MTISSFTTNGSAFGPSLFVLHRRLLTSGLSFAEAEARLTHQIQTGELQTSLMLLAPYHLMRTASGGLRVATVNGVIDATQVYCRQRSARHPLAPAVLPGGVDYSVVTIGFSTNLPVKDLPGKVARAGVTRKARPETAPHDPRDRKIMQLAKQRGVDLRPAVIERIKQMWTALNPDDVPDPEDNKVKKPDFRDEFMKQGPSRITKREYETVWKFARVLAGLPERARAGLKPRKKT